MSDDVKKPYTQIGFTDLDYTLIFSAYGCNTDDRVTVSEKAGKPSMFMDMRQQRFLTWAQQCDWLVPTTARNYVLFSKVKHLGFNPGWAIINYGGLIVCPDGSFEQRWLDVIRPDALAAKEQLEACLAQAAQIEGLEVAIATDADLPFYLQAKNRTNPQGAAALMQLRNVISSMIPADWEIHHNGNDFAVLPGHIRKEIAVKWFLENIAPAERTVIGFGDSLIDLPFMGLCDYLVTPRASQVARTKLYSS
ncbi:MAG: hypothetical protein K2W82_10825 [Candidatus Obscuribacterales bacterium]|nr:hypothetical protein [Candidatus Obscuribacterales bacterium]